LLLLSCGQSTIRFMPPLMISRAHVDEALTIVAASIEEAQNA
jgi:4-aminobutyrate aminotransferase